jgi:alpha-galactosidase
MDVDWHDGHKLTGVASGALLEDGSTISSTRVCDARTCADLEAIRRGRDDLEYTVRSTSPGKPDLLQHIWMYRHTPAIAVQAELIAKMLAAWGRGTSTR